MQRSDGASAGDRSGGGGGGGGSPAAAGAAPPPGETDYARLLRETAAARSRHGRSGSEDGLGGPVPPAQQQSSYPKPSEQQQQSQPPSQQPQQPGHGNPGSDFARLRQQLEASQTKRLQNGQVPGPVPMPAPSAPDAPPPPWHAYPGAAAAAAPSQPPQQQRSRDSSRERSLYMPMKYDADAILAAKLQAEEEERARNARGGSGNVSPAERTRRLVAEEADARLAREMQQAEEAAQRRVREDSLASSELAARETRQFEEQAAAGRRAEQEENLRRDAELARRLQQEESEGHVSSPDSVGSSSRASMSGPRSRFMHQGQRSQGSFGDELGQDGEILIGDDSDSDGEGANERAMAEVHRRHQDANRLRQLQESADRMTGQSSHGGSLGLGHQPREASSARTREQIIRRLHGMQGSYPGIAGQRAASFRFNPDGRLVVGWEDEEPNQAGAGAGAMSSSPRPSHVPGLDEEDEAAQRAAFDQFEREQAARRARQQQQQQGHDDSDDESKQADSSSSSSGGGGFWSGLGNMWSRHSANSRQGVPFPFSVMLDPAQVAEAVRQDAAAHSLSASGGGGGWTSSTGPGGVRVFRWSSGGGGGMGGLRGFGHGGHQAELDVDRMDYDQLLRLEEALGSVRPRVQGARPEQLEELPVWEYKKPKQNANSNANSNANGAAPGGPSSSSSSSSSSAAPAAAAAAPADQAGSECAICMCEFEEGDAIKGLPCMHTFHAAEIDKWLRTNSACPICRVPVGGAPVPP